MFKSMTGYGRYENLAGGKKILVEIKSVNHRYSDYSIKVPRYYGYLEDKIREYVSKYVSRGKIDIYVSIESYGEADKQIILNEELAGNYIEVLRSMAEKFNLPDDITVSSVARYTEIFKSERKEEDDEEIWNLVKEALTPAVEAFSAMREREGERLYSDLAARIEYMKELAAKIDERSPKTVEEYKKKLYIKIKELVEEKDIDEARILTEVAIFADKVAVNEEMVRLASHYDEFYNIANSNEPAGRKLDFLVQEINREVNTTGSKANDIEIAKLVVDLKAEIEKFREQIQNIE